MTVTVNTIWYANFGDGSTTGYYAVALWTLNTPYTVGQIIRQKTTPAVGSERCFVVITAGTSSNTTEPTWATGKGTKSTDAGGPVYMECTGLPALNADLTNTPLSSANRSGAQVLGNLITNNTQDHYFICTTAGTTGAGEPTYSTTTGATTVDSGCTWTCLGAVGSFVTKWGAPHARGANPSSANGDTIYVSSIHAETQAATLTWQKGAANNPTSYICIANAGNIPPQSGDVTTGATVATSANNSMTLGSTNGELDITGIAFTVGSLANSPTLTLGGSSGYIRMRNCALIAGATSAVAFTFGGTACKIELDNTPVTFSGNALQGIAVTASHFVWRDTAPALVLSSGSWPTTLISAIANQGASLLEGLDINAFAGTNFTGGATGGSYVLSHCKIPASLNFLAGSTPGSSYIDVINCDSAGATFRTERWWDQGTQLIETTVVRTGGASDGTTPISWQLSSLLGKWTAPFESMPIVIWNGTTGVSTTVTVEGILNATALPNNDDIWMEAVYFGTLTSTLGTRNLGGKANAVASGTPQTASTAAWNSKATARANTHAYVVANLIAVASNPGRLFICTSAGTSAGTEPTGVGGYSAAVDGGSVTDGGAVFRAMMRFKMVLTLSTPQPQEVGYIYAYVKAVKAATTYWVDPFVTLGP